MDLVFLDDPPWPGNVRELRHVIERALIAARIKRQDGGALAPKKINEYKLESKQATSSPSAERDLNYEDCTRGGNQGTLQQLSETK